MSGIPVRLVVTMAAALFAAACGAPVDPTVDVATGGGAADAVQIPASAAVRGPASVTPAASPPGKPAGRSTAALANRTDELTNPEGTTVVLLYYDLAGLPPPFDRWVENDSRVTMAQANARASARATVRSELEAAAASLGAVGHLRITLAARLSDYDPTYEEFTVRALAPSSAVTFDGFGQKVELRFANGLDAQTWPVPAEEAQAVIDRIGRYGHADANVLLRVTGTQPAPRGGTITTNVVEYELREQRNGHLIGRRKVIDR